PVKGCLRPRLAGHGAEQLQRLFIDETRVVLTSDPREQHAERVAHADVRRGDAYFCRLLSQRLGYQRREETQRDAGVTLVVRVAHLVLRIGRYHDAKRRVDDVLGAADVHREDATHWQCDEGVRDVVGRARLGAAHIAYDGQHQHELAPEEHGVHHALI